MADVLREHDVTKRLKPSTLPDTMTVEHRLGIIERRLSRALHEIDELKRKCASCASSAFTLPRRP